MEKISTSVGPALIEKEPSKSEIVPIFLDSTTRFTPAKGFPEVSVTVPETVACVGSKTLPACIVFVKKGIKKTYSGMNRETLYMRDIDFFIN